MLDIMHVCGNTVVSGVARAWWTVSKVGMSIGMQNIILQTYIFTGKKGSYSKFASTQFHSLLYVTATQIFIPDPDFEDEYSTRDLNEGGDQYNIRKYV